MNSKPKLAVSLFLLFFLPFMALANAGTPLMLAGMFHLLAGNALIGVFEGFLLSWGFSTPRRKSIALMILANYFSAWAGAFGLVWLNGIVNVDLAHLKAWFLLMAFVSYIATLFLEWPFIAFLLRGEPGLLKRSCKAVLLTQTASYVLIFGWYWLVSGTSLVTQWQAVSSVELPLPDKVAVYYIADDKGSPSVYRVFGDCSRKEEIMKLKDSSVCDRLFAWPSQDDPKLWDIYVHDGESRNSKRILLLKGVAREAAVNEAPENEKALLRDVYGGWMNFGTALKLGEARSSKWEFWTGFWAAEGLRGSNAISKESLWVSYETPFGAWYFRNAVHLPGDKVLFESYKDGRIFLADPLTKRVAFLTEGRGAVAVIPMDAAQGASK